MRAKSADAATVFSLAALAPATAPAAQGESLAQKDCVLSSAGLLPTIPGLEIKQASARTDASPDTYTVLITVQAIGRTATYEFTCIYDSVDGALVEGGLLRE